MFNKNNFCHVASNNRNEQKAGLFVYKTADDVETVTTSGYFNEKIIDINLHDVIIHVKTDPTDKTKVEQNVLCVTERTLDNVGTKVVLSQWEGEIDQDVTDILEDIDTIQGDISDIKAKDIEQDGRLTAIEQGAAYKAVDFKTPITSTNMGITQAEETVLNNKINLAANSGRMITDQGLWYAKMDSATVPPAAENGTNYADFSQTDGQGNPIIVTYTRVNGAWVQDQTITPPADYDGYVPITSKIWDIPEQAGQQGGRVLWNHQSKEFTPYPQIISFEDIEVTGQSTVIIPNNPVNNQIVNKNYVDEAIAAIPTPTVDIVQSPDTEIVGTLTIASNGDVTGFSQTDYLVMPGALNMTNSNSFELVFAFATGTTASSAPILKNAATGYGSQSVMGLNTDANSKLHFFVNGTTSVYLTGTTTLQPNTKYYAKLVYDGTDYTLSLSEDGTNWTVEATGLATSIPGILRETRYALGIWSSSNGISTLYLSECYIKKNGILTWQGMDAPGLHQRVAIGHEVIDFKAPTAQDNSWYRKYADGWVEQGGTKTTGGSGDVTAHLPIEMADTDYWTQVGRTSGASTTTNVNVWVRTVTSTTTITIYASGDTGVRWEVKGMYAQS